MNGPDLVDLDLLAPVVELEALPRQLNGMSLAEWRAIRDRTDYCLLPWWVRLRRRPPAGLVWWDRL